ncbi:MAG: DUF3726 domain-containing protein [Proteobacteria bacterium]|nr:DUF3726 domain-containing protein [Pseudomonadota bacterium]
MIVTLNEVQRTCQKAMSGAGAPAGVDDDAAMAAAWLEGRGLPVLGAVAAALDRWAGDASAMELAELPPEGGARRFDAGGRSALFVGAGLIDLAVAMAAETTAETTALSSVEVAGVTDPRFFLPPAVVCARRDRTLRLSWAHPDGAPCAGALVGPDSGGPDSGAVLLGDWRNPAPGGSFQVSIQCGQAGGSPPPGALPATLGPADLDARLAEVLAAGLSVDDRVWTRLAAYGARTLVPSSPESRARGAGPAAG